MTLYAVNRWQLTNPTVYAKANKFNKEASICSFLQNIPLNTIHFK